MDRITEQGWIKVEDAIANETLPTGNTKVSVMYKSGRIVNDRPAWVLTFSGYAEYYKLSPHGRIQCRPSSEKIFDGSKVNPYIQDEIGQKKSPN